MPLDNALKLPKTAPLSPPPAPLLISSIIFFLIEGERRERIRSNGMFVHKPIQSPLFDVLTGKPQARRPIWLMRQAGRYLPEYRDLRRAAPSFLDFCYAPAMAAEATLQPLRRYDFDAGIIFSDILVIPDALGRQVRFEEGEGPKLEPLEAASALDAFSEAKLTTKLAPVYEAIERTRAKMPAQQSLIGFCGAPWTLAVYMIEGGGSRDREKSRRFAVERPGELAEVLDVLVEACAVHLAAQVRAGADVVQIFDSWAEGLSEASFAQAVIGPTQRLVRRFQELAGPDVPVIGFPRGCGWQLTRYARETGVAAIGLDTSFPMRERARAVPDGVATQGNIDPLVLAAGGAALDAAVDEMLRFAGERHVVNLGHGIVQWTLPEHVTQLIARVRQSEASFATA